MKIKKILVSQPKPDSDKSPFHDLAEKNNLKVDFRPFSHVVGISAKEFRQCRIDILEHSAIIFTSKTAIDHFFRICEEMRAIIPDTMKYFCISESVAFYLQKYIVYRKRKIFYGTGTLDDMLDQVNKHNDENYFVPMSDSNKYDIPKVLEKEKIKYKQATLYRNVSNDLTDLSELNYDVLVFYSPSSILALMENFPHFKQNETKIASFGDATAQAVKEAGLRLDIQAPLPQAPSMTMALEQYIKEFNKNCKK
jgi:uroporphyrinogen-III synthase